MISITDKNGYAIRFLYTLILMLVFKRRLECMDLHLNHLHALNACRKVDLFIGVYNVYIYVSH
jgi:hypothetical protein